MIPSSAKARQYAPMVAIQVLIVTEPDTHQQVLVHPQALCQLHHCIPWSFLHPFRPCPAVDNINTSIHPLYQLHHHIPPSSLHPPNNTLLSTTSALESSSPMTLLLAGIAVAVALTPLRQSTMFHTLLSPVPIDSTPSLLLSPTTHSAAKVLRPFVVSH